jgi:hypothetical protein
LVRPGQVAVDWLTGNLYYTQDGSPYITVCNRKRHCLKIIKVLNYYHTVYVDNDVYSSRDQ